MIVFYVVYIMFSIISINVGGLRLAPRNSQILHVLKSFSCDFLFLQEMHLYQDNIRLLQRAFPQSSVFHSHGKSQTCGVAIITRQKVDPTHVDIDAGGRFVTLRILFRTTNI